MKKVVTLVIVLLANLVLSEVITEGFESGVINSTLWEQSGDVNWTVSEGVFHSGNYSACSGDISNNQSTAISIDVDIPVNSESSIRFYKKTSTESGFDSLKFYINNILIDGYSGQNEWSLSEYYFNPTESIMTTFKFEYIKDGSDDAGTDQVWIDDIEITSSDTKSPEFSLSSGYYPNSETLYLTSIYPDATIRYTIDGSDPGVSSTIYDEAFGIPFGAFSDIVTIKAILYLSNGETSIVKSNTYNFNKILSGVISGVLSKSTYNVVGDLTIENGNSLTIKPGVSLLFDGNYCIYVNGKLSAVGNETERIIFTVTNQEKFDDNTTAEGGWGGIVFQDNDKSSSIIDFCELSYGKNLYREGGGIFILKSSDISIKNSSFTTNKTAYQGGGIFILNSNSIVIENNYISSNRALGTDGGGIYIKGSNSTIFNNKITNNSSVSYGGGVYCESSNLIISNNIIDSNFLSSTMISQGGGVYLLNVTASIINNTISNNTSIHGSGLYYYNWDDDCTIKLLGNLVYKNKSIEGFEEDVYSPQSCISLRGDLIGSILNNTIIDNEHELFIEPNGTLGIIFKNDIMYNNNGGANQIKYYYDVCYGDFYNCIIQNGFYNFNNTFTGAFFNCVDIDPDLILDSSNPNLYQPNQDSPCINFGNADTAAEGFPESDLAGNPRIFGNRIDIGAYELQNDPIRATIPEYSISSGHYFNYQTVNITCTTAGAEIRYTIDGSEPNIYSNRFTNSISVQKDTIIRAKAFSSGMDGSYENKLDVKIGSFGYVSGTWTKINSPYIINDNLLVEVGETLNIEAGVDVIFNGSYKIKVYGHISAIGTPAEKINFTVSDSTGFGSTATLEGGWMGFVFVDNQNSDNVFKYCDFKYGKKIITQPSTYFEDYWGGFFYIEDSKLKIENCSFKNGMAHNGGAIYITGDGFDYDGISSDVEIIDCLFSKNTAEYSSAISINGESNVDITNSTIANNIELLKEHAGSGAVNIINFSTSDLYSSTIKNSIIYGNTSNSISSIQIGLGGNASCNPSISNCLIQNGIISGIDNNTGETFSFINIIDADPRFSNDLESPYSLLASSPCVNMGDNSVAGLPGYDLSGNTRTYEGTIDLGAYELQTTAFTNPVLKLSEYRIFEFNGVTSEKILNISNDGNANLAITFSLNGMSNSFTIEGISGTFINSESDVKFNIIPYGVGSLSISYNSTDPSVVKHDILNFISNDLVYNVGNIDLAGENLENPDITVLSAPVSYSGYNGLPVTVEWTVTNLNKTATNSSWTDRVCLSNTSEPPEILVSKFLKNLTYLKEKESYTQKCVFDIPLHWVPGAYSFQIRTNVSEGNELIEDSYGNNETVKIPLNIGESPQADLQVAGPPVSSYDLGIGESYQVSWSVSNIGEAYPNSGTWYDAVYLSQDKILNINEDYLLAKSKIDLPGGLPIGTSYPAAATVTIPQIASEGFGYIFVFTDRDNNIYEYSEGESNNYSLFAEVKLISTGLPDLTSSIEVPESTVSTGELVNITCTVFNELNSRAPFESVCRDRIHLSQLSPSEFDPLQAYTLYTNTKTGIDVLLENPDQTTRSSYSFVKALTIPLNTGFDPSKSYFDSYLFSSNESSKNTLGYFGYHDLKDEDVAKIVTKLKTSATTLSNKVKSEPDFQSNLYMSADYDNKVYEGAITDGSEKNNISNFPVTITISPCADLIFNQVTADKNEFIPGDLVSISWTVQNSGMAAAVPKWIDKIYISPENYWDKDASKLIGQTEIVEELGIAGSYTKTMLLKIPKDILSYGNSESFAESYVHIITDAVNNVYERYGDDSGNISESKEVKINIRMPASDMMANKPTASGNLNGYRAGGTLTVNWSVKNNGPDKTYATSWSDQIDLYQGGMKKASLGACNRIEALKTGSTYEVSQDFYIPVTLSEGDYNLCLTTDAKNEVNDTVLLNNTNLSSSTIFIKRHIPCDLVVTDVQIIKDDGTTSYEIFAGQTFKVNYTVLNQGESATNEEYWNDGFYLSRDRVWDGSDLLIGSMMRKFDELDGVPVITLLGPRGTYTQTAEITLTTEAFGDYYLLVKADIHNKVFEYMTETNNFNYQYAYVNYTEVVDLAVSDVSISEPVSLESPATVTYTVTNLGANPAVGTIRDAVYVSRDDVWSSDDLLVSYLDRNIDLPAYTKEIITTQTDFTRTIFCDSKGNPTSGSKDVITDYLPGLEPGTYHVIVRTNITLSIREDINSESAMANNICPSLAQPADTEFTIDLPVITLGTIKDDAIPLDGVKYYQITVPEITNESLRIILDEKAASKDTDTINEMYLKYGSMPTLSNYDQAFNNPNGARQEIIVPNTQTGIYYLMVKNKYHSVASQDITIDAKLMGFELLYIDQSKGGNGGELTIKMTGTGFEYGVKPKLIKGIKEIKAKETYYTDKTEMYATFDLKGADYGDYDVTLVQDMSRYEFTYESMVIEGETVQVPTDMFLVPDSIVTTLSGQFEVEASNYHGYLENKDIPENARGGRGFDASIEVTNISNNDIIAPLFMLKAGTGMKSKLPGEDEYTAGYKKFLVLANEGPAGILRPSGRGNVQIYATAPLTMDDVLFDIMRVQESGFQFDFNVELDWVGISKQDPEVIEPIYQIEQEIGNSWEGYNKVLANEATKLNKAYKYIMYLSVENFLHNKINDTCNSLRLINKNDILFNSSNSEITMNGSKGIIDDVALYLAQETLNLFIESFLLTRLFYAASYLNYFVYGTQSFAGLPLPIIFEFSPNSEIASLARSTNFINNRQHSYYNLNAMIVRNLRKGIYDMYENESLEILSGAIKDIDLLGNFPSNDSKINPLMCMKEDKSYISGLKYYSEAPNKSPSPEFSLGGDFYKIVLYREGNLVLMWNRMLGAKSVTCEIIFDEKSISSNDDSACFTPIPDSDGKYEMLGYTAIIKYRFFDDYTFDNFHNVLWPGGSAGYTVAISGTAHTFESYLNMEEEFYGWIKVKSSE